jgi:hypothetical protein
VLGWLRRRRLAARACELLPEQREIDAICDGTPSMATLDTALRVRLRERTAWILADKTFHGAGGLEPDWSHCLPVAVHAALPLLNGRLDWYRQFRSFILYREEFEVDVEEEDDAGLVHRGRDRRAGEAWYRGPVVLSLADVEASGQGSGYDVVIHELAHQIDRLSGDADGRPPLPSDIEARDWSDTFSAAYQRLSVAVDGLGEPVIDPYAAESPAEFFAVAVEYFFDRPDLLRRHEAGVYRLLSAWFRQDPAARVAG